MQASTMKTVLFQGNNHALTIHHRNDPFKQIFVISYHPQIAFSDFEANAFLLFREQFWNKFLSHTSHSLILG